MKEDLYEQIERYNQGDMEADEAAAFREQMQADDSVAEEVWLNQRMDDTFSDTRKMDLRATLSQLGDQYDKKKGRVVGFRHWLPVIVSTAAAAVALYFLVRTNTLSPASSPGTDTVEIIPETDGQIAQAPIPENMPRAYDDSLSPELRRSLGLRLGQASIHEELDPLVEFESSGPIDIETPEMDQVFLMGEEPKSHKIKGQFKEKNSAGTDRLVIELFNAEESLQTPDTVKVNTADSSAPSFEYPFVLPDKAGWYYYQLSSEKGKVLYTGRFGIWRE